MTIDYQALVGILTEYCSWGDDTSPKEALYVRFLSNERKAKETLTYNAADGTIVAIDFDETGAILGIELI